MGGTYNPVHLGHLSLALEIRSRLDYDLVLLVPANMPAHKNRIEGATAAQRLDMLNRAVRRRRGLVVEECEIRRGGVSYTVDTVRHVLSSYRPSGKPGLVIGDDLLADFASWRRAEELACLTDIIVAHRFNASRQPFGFRHTYLDNPLVPISSSEIRRRIAARMPVARLLPKRVIRYIRKHRLYGYDRAPSRSAGASLPDQGRSGYSPGERRGRKA